MSDLMKQMGGVYDVLWNNKEFPICASLRSDVLPAIEALQDKVDELQYKLDEAVAIAEREVMLRKKLKAKVDELTEYTQHLELEWIPPDDLDEARAEFAALKQEVSDE